MGKKKLKPKAQGDYPYPSRFGSHSSMEVISPIIDSDPPNPEAEALEQLILSLENHQILLEDEYGMYVTERKFLDTGLMDPHRTNGAKRPRILK